MTQPNEPLTLTQVRDAAKKVVAERGPDFQYIKDHEVGDALCLYAPTSHPAVADMLSEASAPLPASAAVTGCLVGEILDRLGRRTDEVAASRGGLRSLVDGPNKLVRATGPATEFLVRLQVSQDQGKTWGETLALVEEAAN